MERREEFALLRWLAWTQALNGFRWGVRRPSFWLFVVMLAVMTGVFAAMFTSIPPEAPGSLSFGSAHFLFALFLFCGGLFCGMFGPFLLFVPRPVADIVYPAPLDRATFLQARVRKALLGLGAAVAGISGVMGAAGGLATGGDAGLIAGRVFLVILPALGFFHLSGFLAAYGMSRAPPRASNVIAVAVFFAFLAGLPSLITLDFPGIRDDPLVLLWLTLALPATNVVLGAPMAPADLLYLACSWTGFLSLAISALRWPYVLFEDLGTRSIPSVGPLTRERTSPPSAFQGLRVRLRIPYQDVGPGWRGLLGRNLMALFRGPSLILHIVFVAMFVGLLIPLAALMADAGGDSGNFGAWFAILMGGVIVSIIPMISAGTEGPRDPQVRLLPLTPSKVFLAYSIPAMGPALGWALMLGAMALAVGADFGTALTGVALIASLGALSTSGLFLGGSFAPRRPPLSPDIEIPPGAPSPAVVSISFVALIELPFLLSVGIGRSATELGLGIAGVNFLLAFGTAVAAIDLYRRPPRR